MPDDSNMRIYENAMHMFLHHMNYVETKLCINKLTNGLMMHIERGGDKLSLTSPPLFFSEQIKVDVSF